MRIAVLYNDKDVYVEIPSDKFRDLLKTYMGKFKDIDAALDQIEKDLRKLTLYK